MYWLIKIHYKIAFYLYWSLRIQQPLESRASACSKLKKQYSCNLNNRHWNSHVIGWPLEYQTFHSTAGYMHLTAEKFENTPFIKNAAPGGLKKGSCMLLDHIQLFICQMHVLLWGGVSGFPHQGSPLACARVGCSSVDCLIECPQWIFNW